MDIKSGDHHDDWVVGLWEPDGLRRIVEAPAVALGAKATLQVSPDQSKHVPPGVADWTDSTEPGGGLPFKIGPTWFLLLSSGKQCL